MNRVLLVSKPICPPWSDSSKNLAKDIARWSERTEFVLLGRPEFQPPWQRVQWCPVYAAGGSYSPGPVQNARVLYRLLRPPVGVSILHYFFAPNPLTSSVARIVTASTRFRTVHSICSMPSTYVGIRRLMFADRVVALSRFSSQTLRGAGVPGVLCIPPGIDPDRLTVPETNQLAEKLGLRDHPVVLYAGDYESPGGHQVLLEAIPKILAVVPEARFVFACRPKTAASINLELAARATVEAARITHATVFLRHVEDMASLIALATVAALPTASLHRKMDIPLVLLECMAMLKPVVVSDLEPLNEIIAGGGGLKVPVNDAGALARALVGLLTTAFRCAELGQEARAAVVERWHISRVAGCYEALYDELARGGRG